MNLSTDKPTASLINRVAQRAHAELTTASLLQLQMDLAACHLNGCTLNLHQLIGSHRRDFAHDVLGIVEHVDRATGTLRDCFHPRCAA